MTRSDITLPGSPQHAAAMKACQSKTCNGAERPPEGGVDLNATKWICAGCWAVKKRRLFR